MPYQPVQIQGPLEIFWPPSQIKCSSQLLQLINPNLFSNFTLVKAGDLGAKQASDESEVGFPISYLKVVYLREKFLFWLNVKTKNAH